MLKHYDLLGGYQVIAGRPVEVFLEETVDSLEVFLIRLLDYFNVSLLRKVRLYKSVFNQKL